MRCHICDQVLSGVADDPLNPGKISPCPTCITASEGLYKSDPLEPGEVDSGFEDTEFLYWQ